MVGLHCIPNSEAASSGSSNLQLARAEVVRRTGSKVDSLSVSASEQGFCGRS
jgi:hypothetical protein